MKTTINIPDQLFVAARQQALEERKTFTQFLVQLLEESVQGTKPYKLPVMSFKGEPGLQPGIDPDNWQQIKEFMYEDRGS